MIPNFWFYPVVGRPFAVTICMIMAILRLSAPSEKRMELSQTIASLIGYIRTEKGCKRCDFYQSIKDENKLCLPEEWDSQENLKSYLKSGRFRILRGQWTFWKSLMKWCSTSRSTRRKRGGLMDKLLFRKCLRCMAATVPIFQVIFTSRQKGGEIMRILFISLLLLTLVGCAHPNFASHWPALY